MDTRYPNIVSHGPASEHDQCCAVHWGQSAVLNHNRGVFEPSWAAQNEGWALVRARTSWQRFLLRQFFGAFE